MKIIPFIHTLSADEIKCLMICEKSYYSSLLPDMIEYEIVSKNEIVSGIALLLLGLVCAIRISSSVAFIVLLLYCLVLLFPIIGRFMYSNSIESGDYKLAFVTVTKKEMIKADNTKHFIVFNNKLRLRVDAWMYNRINSKSKLLLFIVDDNMIVGAGVVKNQ